MKKIFCLTIVFLGWMASGASFTALAPLPTPRIVNSSPQLYTASDKYNVTNLVDGNLKSEYASKNAGMETFVDFDFGAPVSIAAFRHVDRGDNQPTIAMSQLEFFDGNGQLISTASVKHVNQPGGETIFILPSPVTAQRVKWRVTKLGGHARAVGGAEISFLTVAGSDMSPNRDRIAVKFISILEKNGKQPVQVTISHLYEEPADVVLDIAGEEPKPLHLHPGANTFEFEIPAVQAAGSLDFKLQYEGQIIADSEFEQQPVRPLTVYVLPMSHTDIGYALSQSASADKQVNNLMEGIAAARRTADYPRDSRFVWNVEVLWAVDQYMHRMDAKQRAAFIDAVKQGQVALDGSYANELTGLCRPEELIQLFRYSTEMSEQTGVPIESAMISDVPGYTWGTVTAMSQAGIKYFSAAPNYFDRIGTIFRDCENRPFYWVAPDGKTKVLTWIPYRGYAMSHIYQNMSLRLIGDFLDELDRVNYPYDIAYVRWAGHHDNAEPDPAICDFIKDWNAKYVWPHFVISGTTTAFQAFELRYGNTLPRFQGDWTPYWEDGAGSTALETAENRNNGDRLTQADALWAMLDPRAYPAGAFSNAWKNVLLYSEHTWGADCSIRQAESQKTKEQWAVKKAYADDADCESRTLLAKAIETRPTVSDGENNQRNLIDVINTLSWLRSGLVTVSPQLSFAGDLVTDENGRPATSQRLSTGELVFWATNIPPFIAKRYTISPGAAYAGNAAATAGGATLDSGSVRVRVDRQTGGIAELTGQDTEGNLVDTSGGEELNEYLYLPGDDLTNLEMNGPVQITAGEKGPLVASLVIESDAPGCNELCRKLQVVAGQDYVEINNLVDKARLQTHDYIATKESVNFAFPFNVPDGNLLLDIPLGGAMDPVTQQIPGSCKNWFTVGRWVDVSNGKQGVTWVTLDAPLIEVGGLTARLLNSQTDPNVWRQKVDPTQKFYSWVMNNHWSSNYRAFQEGPTTFRYVLRPHGQMDPAGATRFATGFSQPLLAVPASNKKPFSLPLLALSSDDVVVSDLKPSDDGKAWMVRLFGASGKDTVVKLHWGSRGPRRIFASGTDEKKGTRLGETISVPGYGLVTLRAEF
jgi:alpha-mannosidase